MIFGSLHIWITVNSEKKTGNEFISQIYLCHLVESRSPILIALVSKQFLVEALVLVMRWVRVRLISKFDDWYPYLVVGRFQDFNNWQIQCLLA